jgi:hypothetical protein
MCVHYYVCACTCLCERRRRSVKKHRCLT